MPQGSSTRIIFEYQNPTLIHAPTRVESFWAIIEFWKWSTEQTESCPFLLYGDGLSFQCWSKKLLFSGFFSLRQKKRNSHGIQIVKKIHKLVNNTSFSQPPTLQPSLPHRQLRAGHGSNDLRCWLQTHLHPEQHELQLTKAFPSIKLNNKLLQGRHQRSVRLLMAILQLTRQPPLYLGIKCDKGFQ